MLVKDLKEVCLSGCYLVDSEAKNIVLDYEKFIFKDNQKRYDEKRVIALTPFYVENLYGEGEAVVLIALIKDLN